MLRAEGTGGRPEVAAGAGASCAIAVMPIGSRQSMIRTGCFIGSKLWGLVSHRAKSGNELNAIRRLSGDHPGPLIAAWPPKSLASISIFPPAHGQVLVLMPAYRRGRALPPSLACSDHPLRRNCKRDRC